MLESEFLFYSSAVYSLEEFYNTSIAKTHCGAQDVPVPLPELCLKESDCISRSRVLFLQQIQTINHYKRPEIHLSQAICTNIH